ncbi:MAG: L-serine ammonia-lyase, iron-sulfur-dependent, subunit alpha [Christensenellales bacterium]|jgi:L-serine dehydratase
MQFHSLRALVERAQRDRITIGRAALLTQAQMDQADEHSVSERMRETMRVMFDSVAQGMNPDTKSVSGLTGGQASKLMALAEANRAPGGQSLARAEAYALAAAEWNASMGRIVAAPTAGACGILPAALLTAREERGADEDALLDALFCAAGVGAVIAHRATISGAEGGCQAECGSAAAMAAAALSQIAGASPSACARAAGFALMNLMGLVCDPVMGLVEIPCVYRNVIGIAAALTSADLATAEIPLPLDPDDIIDAMGRVGRQMPSDLRETGRGGCASCKVCI